MNFQEELNTISQENQRLLELVNRIALQEKKPLLTALKDKTKKDTILEELNE